MGRRCLCAAWRGKGKARGHWRAVACQSGRGEKIMTTATEELSQRDPAVADEIQIQNYTINFGPQHPAAHGVLRMVMELDGEIEIGRASCRERVCQYE